MTTLLYIMFYVWLTGVVLVGLLYLAAIKIVGGREEFRLLLNKVQNTNYSINHLDWAIVIGVMFWPSTMFNAWLNSQVRKTPVDNTDNP